MTRKNRWISSPEVGEVCDNIEARIEAYDSDPDLDVLLHAQSDIEKLRKGYRKAPDAFKSHVRRLQGLSQAIRLRLTQASADLIDNLWDTRESVRALERRERLLKSALIEVCETGGAEEVELNTPRVTLSATRVVRIQLPKSNSTKRHQLVQTLKDGQCLEMVSTISWALLNSAVRKNRLPDEMESAVRELCTETTTYQLRTSLRPDSVEPDRDDWDDGDDEDDDWDDLDEYMAMMESITEEDEAEDEEWLRIGDDEFEEWVAGLGRSDEDGWFYDDGNDYPEIDDAWNE